MKSLLKTTLVLFALILLASCNDERKRQVQYMSDTDMYVPVGYETYGLDTLFSNGTSARLPVVGTIARGTVPYEYEFSEAGYQLAKDSLKSPLKYKTATDTIFKVSDVNLTQGKVLYGIYCATCHGDKGDGQGDLVKNEKFLGIPNYKDRDITDGSIYHVIMYGRNLMGSHSSQLNATERWQVVSYVEQLRNDLLK